MAIKILQLICPHPKVSDWIDEYWAIAHGTGFQVKVCKICGKFVARRTWCWKCGELTENAQNGIGTNSRPFGSWYCPKCIERIPKEIASDIEITDAWHKATKQRKIKHPQKSGAVKRSIIRKAVRKAPPKRSKLNRETKPRNQS